MNKKEINKIKNLLKIKHDTFEFSLLKEKYKNLSSCMLHIFLIVLYTWLIILFSSIFIKTISI